MYSIDSSAILDGWVRYYSPDVFQTVWANMEQLGRRGGIVAIEEVHRELEKKEDGAYAWAKAQLPSVPIDEPIQQAVAQILARYPRLVDSRKARMEADPFVIALAQLKGLAVVTGEKPTGNLEKPNIPDVCQALGIAWMGLLEMFRQQGWQI